MTPPASGSGFPFDGDPDGLRDAPLFREMQRVMASSSGPINRELARQVGVATASEGASEDPEPTDEERRDLAEAVRVAELHIARLTGLTTGGEVMDAVAVRRGEWVNANIRSLGDVLEPAAGRLSAAMSEMTGTLGPEGEGEAASGFDQGLLGQLTPLLMGAQTGQILGALAAKVFGQFEVPVPRGDAPPTLLLVPSNITRFQRDWSLDPADLRLAIALREVATGIALGRPWTRERFQELLTDFASTLRIDADGLRAQLGSIEAAGPEAVGELLGGGDGFFDGDMDDEQRLKLARIQAFCVATAGYGTHVASVLSAELLADPGRTTEALRRHAEEDAADPLFERLLGIEIGRGRFEQGDAFCRTVADMTDEATLARMWESPEALPSLPEILEPSLWLARTV